MGRAPKGPGLVFAPAADAFKLYFDVRLQAADVQDLLTYVNDGRFLDDATQSLQARGSPAALPEGRRADGPDVRVDWRALQRPTPRCTTGAHGQSRFGPSRGPLSA